MSDILTSSLLFKRDFDYDQFTQNIINIISTNLEAAVKLYFKKNRSMVVRQIDLKPEILPGYAFIQLAIRPNLGDIVILNNAELIIDESNINSVNQIANIVISLKALDTNSSLIMYKNICDVQKILNTSKEDTVQQLLQLDLLKLQNSSEITNFIEVEILENPEFIKLLEILTNPPDVDIMGFDKSKLSKTQIDLLHIRNIMKQEQLIS